MRNGYVVEMVTSIDIGEIVEMVGNVIKSFEGVNHRENFKKSLLKKLLILYLL